MYECCLNCAWFEIGIDEDYDGTCMLQGNGEQFHHWCTGYEHKDLIEV